jgi:nucleoside-diphosphate-sugar epimerase
MTGGSGYIGLTIISLLPTFSATPYTVYALSRTPASDEKLRPLGATPVRGTLETLSVLQAQAADADIIIHLASHKANDYSEVLKVDHDAVTAMAEGMVQRKKEGKGEALLITTSGTGVVEPDAEGRETNEESPLKKDPINRRGEGETYAMSLNGTMGVRVSVVRLAPYVYGRGGSGVRLFMQMARANGEVMYVDEGEKRTSAMHVDDAARLFILVAEKGEGSEVYNCVASTDVTQKQLAEAMGEVLKLPVRSIAFEEASKRMGMFFARFLSLENRGSSEKARKVLGWLPREIGILDDIREGSYQSMAASLSNISA